jgi:pectin methylesterase-like acyl-CoA thioesterase
LGSSTFFIYLFSRMNPLSCRPLWLAGPALALGVLLTSCSSEPKATDPDKTAEVVSDQKTVDVTADSAGATATDTTKMK